MMRPPFRTHPDVPSRPPFLLDPLRRATFQAQLHRGALHTFLRGDVRLMTASLFDYWETKAKRLEGR
jgi:hypothetical protein